MVWWYASSLFPPHATAVDLSNRDRNPGIDDVPSGAAPYNVTRLAQNSCRLQPESRSIIGHNTRPSLPPQVLPLPPLAAPLPDSRLQPYLNKFSKAADSRRPDIQRSHLQSARVILPSGYFSSTRPALYFFFCNGLRNSVPAAERIQLRNAFWLKFLASFRANRQQTWTQIHFYFKFSKGMSVPIGNIGMSVARSNRPVGCGCNVLYFGGGCASGRRATVDENNG